MALQLRSRTSGPYHASHSRQCLLLRPPARIALSPSYPVLPFLDPKVATGHTSSSAVSALACTLPSLSLSSDGIPHLFDTNTTDTSRRFIFVFLFIPKTKGLSPERMDDLFSVTELAKNMFRSKKLKPRRPELRPLGKSLGKSGRRRGRRSRKLGRRMSASVLLRRGML